MDVLRACIAGGQPVTLKCDGAASVAALVPVDRSAGCVAFRVVDAQRFLRIRQSGEVDLNGGRGPWTEFRAIDVGRGAVELQGVRSGFWLAVADGAFASASEPARLSPAAADEAQSSPGAEPAHEEGGYQWLRLASGAGCLPWPVRLERWGGSVYLSTSAGKNVAFRQGGRASNTGGAGVWAQWEVEQVEGGCLQFKSVAHGKYLAIDAAGSPILSEEPARFTLSDAQASLPEGLPAVDLDVLSQEEVARFKDLGYLILRRGVLPEFVRDALRSINHQLGKPGCWQADPNPLNASQLALKLGPGSVGGQMVQESPRLWSAVNILLGEGNVDRAGARSPQVAMNFPVPPEKGFNQPDRRANTIYHIDGMGQNRLHPFTLLCGVALSDQSMPNCGNLNVFPGSHLDADLHRYYRERINDETQSEADLSKPDVGGPTQVLLQPGDVVIAHQLLAHRIGQNTSEHIRYQLYFRLCRKDHAKFKDLILKDPWVEFAI